jgi:hypothetical protein
MSSIKYEDENSLSQQAGGHDPIHVRWSAEIELYEEEFKKYYTDCKRISDRYRDDKGEKKRGQYNVFWSQMENLKPAVFYYLPKVEVARRYKDKDPVGRIAGEILERATQYQLEENYHFNRLEKVRDDFLMYGRGTAWLRYIPTIEEQPVKVPAELDPMTGQPPEGALLDPQTGQYYTEVMQEVVTYEEIIADYIHRKDFGHTMARTWEEVMGVWRISYLTKDECVKRFGEEIGAKIPMNFMPKGIEDKDELEKSLFKKAEIYEIWDKQNKRVIWLHKGLKEQILDIKPDPLGLKDFFPCPRPCYGSLDTESLKPIPDYMQYEAISEALDTISARISAVEKALKITGLYDATKEAVKRIATEGVELALIPVDNWASFAQSGGLERCIEWMPIKDIANVLQSLYQIKNSYKQDLYEISGMSDIVRGQTDPRETATAQRTKAQFATLRMDHKQKNFASFCRDLIALMGEIISEQFQPETIASVAGVQELGPEYQQAFPASIELLKNDRQRCYRIDIETDSTLALDEQADQEQSTQFINMLTQGLNDILPVIQAMPMFAPVLSEALMFVARKFNAGRSLEGALEQAFMAIQQQPPQQPQPEGKGGAPADPQIEQAKMQQEAQGKQMEMQAQVVASQNEKQWREAQMQQDGAIQVAQLQFDKEKFMTETQLEAAKLAQKKQEMDTKLQLSTLETGAKIQQAIAPSNKLS